MPARSVGLRVELSVNAADAPQQTNADAPCHSMRCSNAVLRLRPDYSAVIPHCKGLRRH